MHWPSGAAALLAAATILDGALATLVTVTEYPSACPNTNHHPSRSTKVVQSTVTVSPAPFTDHDANHGVPFSLEVQVATGNTRHRRAAAAMYVMTTGYTTESPKKAAQYVIKQGMLMAVSGGYVSADLGTQHMPFAVSSTLKQENALFHVRDGILGWDNDYFDKRMATFYEILPSGNKKRAEVVMRFTGPIFSTWTPIVLAVVPAVNATSSSSATPTSATGHSKHHKSHSSATKTRTKHHHEATTMSASTTRHRHHHTKSSGIYTNSSSTGPPTSTSSSQRASVSGLCGPAYGGQTCLDSGFGNCCSEYGYCGSDATYCSGGCLQGYGNCWNMTRNSKTMSTTSISMGNYSLSSSTVSISTPSSTVTSLSGPIGPNHPLSFNISMRSTTGSANLTSTSTFSGSSLTSSTTSTMSGSPTPAAPPCPSSSASLCGSGSSSDNSTTCSSSSGTPYNTTCGVEYQGTTINTTGIVGLPPSHMMKRAIEYSLADCQTLCDYYTACVAINYIGTNCTLLSHVTSTTRTPDSVGAAVPPQDVAAKTNPVTTTTGASTAVSSSGSQSGSVQSSVLTSSMSSVLSSTTTNRVAISSTSTLTSHSSSGPSSSSMVSSPANSTVSSTQQSSSSVTSSTQQSSSTGTTASSSPSASSSSSVISTTGSLVSSSSSTGPSSSSSTITSGSGSQTTSSSTSTTTSATSLYDGYLILSSPTACSFPNPAGANEDDSYCEIPLPFSMQIYSQSDTHSYASTNGLLSILSGSSQYSNQRFPASNIPNNTVAPFWDDLYLRGTSTPQDGIFYQINTAQTGITYEYYLNRGNSAGSPPTSNATYHFTVAYDSTQPGIFTFTYYATGGSSDDGLYAAVGMQGISNTGTETGFTYSFQDAVIVPGLVVKCTTSATSANTCVTVSGG